MKKICYIFLALSITFLACQKEESAIEIEEEPTIYNAWQLSMQSAYLGHGDTFVNGVITINNTIYTGQIQYLYSGSIMISNDTIFPSNSTSYSSRVWSINENQLITETYYDGNGFAYATFQHNFTKNSDTMVVNFQSGDIKEFVINELTADQLHFSSIADTNYIPLFDVNGIYQDTVLINIISDTYLFDIIQ
jgi:hypothetical protein